jgi:hypothetical protein
MAALDSPLSPIIPKEMQVYEFGALIALGIGESLYKSGLAQCNKAK